MNNEPVAWVIGTCHDDYRNVTQVLREAEEELEHYKKEYPNDRIIPLYTHPAQKPTMVLDGNHVYLAFKELTDEEIRAIARNTYLWNQGKQEWSEVDFARAILRKAQEK